MELLKLLPDIFPHPFYIKNDLGNFILANDAFAQLYETKAANLLAKGFLTFDFAFDRDLEILKAGHSTTLEECFKLKNGRKVWFSTVKKPFEQPDGRAYLISVSSDISIYKKWSQDATDTIVTEDTPLPKNQLFINNTATSILELAWQMSKALQDQEQQLKIQKIVTLAQSLLVITEKINSGESTAQSEKQILTWHQEDSPNQIEPTVSAQVDQKLMILVAEDNEANLELISAQLSTMGVIVEVARNGEEALTKARERVFGLILMNIQMPLLDGIAATKLIRQEDNPNYKTPIIAFTKNIIGISPDHYKTNGFTDFLPKPYAESELMAIIYRYISPSKKQFLPELKLYDFSGLGDLGRDAVFIRKMQSLFIQTVPQQLNELSEAVAEQDWELVASIAHKLKSTYGNIRIKEPAAAMKNIELIAQEKKRFSEIPDLLHKTKETTAKVVLIFSQQLQDLA